MAEVMETWKDDLTTHILTSLEAIHSRFETRLQDLEKRRVSDHAVIDQLTDRVSELEMMISRSELEANLVVTGVKETEGENPKDVFLSICHNKLDTKIAEDDVLEAVRLGPQPQTPANDKSFPASVSPRPRPLLVRTKNKVTKTAVMSARKNSKAPICFWTRIWAVLNRSSADNWFPCSRSLDRRAFAATSTEHASSLDSIDFSRSREPASTLCRRQQACSYTLPQRPPRHIYNPTIARPLPPPALFSEASKQNSPRPRSPSCPPNREALRGGPRFGALRGTLLKTTPIFRPLSLSRTLILTNNDYHMHPFHFWTFPNWMCAALLANSAT